MRKRSSYLEWLGLVSHEFFHTWNVRRLRPRGLMTYHYEAEQYVPELWIAEGITSYFDDLLVLRASLATAEEYLGLLSKTLLQVEDMPGRLVQSLEASSFDTWIKHYRPDENSINSRISYYTKGAAVAFLLDIELRQLTEHRVTLAQVMCELWRRFRTTGYTLQDFEKLASELTRIDLSFWFSRHVSQAEPLDFSQAFAWLGIECESTPMVAPQGMRSGVTLVRHRLPVSRTGSRMRYRFPRWADRHQQGSARRIGVAGWAASR